MARNDKTMAKYVKQWRNLEKLTKWSSQGIFGKGNIHISYDLAL
jgi:hypothetical protein